MKFLSLFVILFLSQMVVSCLGFGDNVELSGAEFDAARLAEVSKLTTISLPEGTRGMEYYYQGSGIDDALVVKVSIPDSKISEFKSNSVFIEGENLKATTQIGANKHWWKIDELTDRSDRKLKLSNSIFLEVTCGREGNQFVVYISWFTI